MQSLITNRWLFISEAHPDIQHRICCCCCCRWWQVEAATRTTLAAAHLRSPVSRPGHGAASSPGGSWGIIDAPPPRVIAHALLCPFRHARLTRLEPQSRFGDKPLKFQVVCPQNGTAVLKGFNTNRVFLKQHCCRPPSNFNVEQAPKRRIPVSHVPFWIDHGFSGSNVDVVVPFASALSPYTLTEGAFRGCSRRCRELRCVQ